MNVKLTEKDYRNFFKGSWFKYRTIPLTYEFIQFLEDENQYIDEVVMSKHLQIQKDYQPEREIDGEDEEIEWDKPEDSNVQVNKKEQFPGFNKRIQEVIEDFSDVFVKLDHVSAKDMNNWVPSLRCRNLSDIYQVLKNSDLIQDYVTEISIKPKEEIQSELILIQWYQLNHALEFDLEIENGKVIAIYQRRLENYFDYLQKVDFIQDTLNKIATFWNEIISEKVDKLPENCKMSIYVDPYSQTGKIIIFGISESKDDSFPLKEDREHNPDFTLSSQCDILKNIKIYTLRSEKEIRYKLWAQDYPSEYFELSEQNEGFKQFFDTFQKAQDDQKLRNAIPI